MVLRYGAGSPANPQRAAKIALLAITNANVAQAATGSATSTLPSAKNAHDATAAQISAAANSKPRGAEGSAPLNKP